MNTTRATADALVDTATTRYGLTEIAIHHAGSTQSRTVAFACPTEPERIAVEIHPHGARVTVYSYDGPDPYILGTEFIENHDPAAILDLACDLIAYADEVNR